MTNPLIHALVFVAAVMIPGGLLVYLAWRATRRAVSRKTHANQSADSEDCGHIPESLPDPDEVREAFRNMYPTYPPDSLRAHNRINRLQRYKTALRKKSK